MERPEPRKVVPSDGLLTEGCQEQSALWEEYMLAMVAQKLGVGKMAAILRKRDLSRFVEKAVDLGFIVARRFQDLIVWADGHQPIVEHPVYRSKQGYPIVEGVGTGMIYGFDMGTFHLKASVWRLD